jgi:hypothetical protein
MRLTDYAGPSWLTMTPLNGMTWVYDDFVDPKTKGADTEVFGASMWDNAVSVGGHIPDAEIEQVEQSIKDPIERRIRIYGEFLSQVGRIYKLWNEDVHVLAELPANLVLPGGQIRPEFDTYCAIDTGRCFAAGFYVADYLGNVYKFDEHYDESEDERGTIAYRGRTVLNICARYEIWPTFIVDKSTQFYTDLAELGIHCQLSDTTDVLRGIDVVRDYLAYDEKKPLGPLQCNPRFYVLDRCEETRREYPRYQWDTPSRSGPTEGEKKNKPKKKNDHALDCDRMMLELRPDASKPPTADEDSRPLPEKIRERVREKVSGRYQEKVRQASDPWGIDDY